MGWGIKALCLNSQHRQEIFLFCKVSTLVLWPILLLIQRASGLKQLGGADDCSPPPNVEVMHIWSCTFTPPIFNHGYLFTESENNCFFKHQDPYLFQNRYLLYTLKEP